MTGGTDAFDASPLLARMAKLSRADLEALQLVKLKKLLARLHANSLYYRRRMDDAKLTADSVKSVADFCARFPVSTKADFMADQAEHPPFGHRLSMAREKVALVNTTGGTSGQGQEVYGRSQRDVHTQGYYHALPWFMAGLRPGQIAVNCVPAGGMTTGGWGPGEGLRIIGATAFHVGGGTLTTEAVVDLMVRIRDVSFIYASTNFLHRLTQCMTKRGMTPREAFPHMKGLFIAAEGYPVEWAQKIEQTWGCTLHEGYGSTQLAGFGASTPGSVAPIDGSRGLMRFFEWEHIVEVINPETGQPAKSGETGEMVITNLSIEGSPVVRFRSGDAARFFAHQDAGGGMAWNAIESGTIGRYDDMMKIRGNNVWPSAVDGCVFAHPEIVEYIGRVFTTQDGKTEVEVRIAFTDHPAPCAAAERERIIGALKQTIKQRTNVNMDVVEVPRAELPEFTYKARRWKDERQQGYKL
jgi:phenylacetate-CoA ligase